VFFRNNPTWVESSRGRLKPLVRERSGTIVSRARPFGTWESSEYRRKHGRRGPSSFGNRVTGEIEQSEF